MLKPCNLLHVPTPPSGVYFPGGSGPSQGNACGCFAGPAAGWEERGCVWRTCPPQSHGGAGITVRWGGLLVSQRALLTPPGWDGVFGNREMGRKAKAIGCSLALPSCFKWDRTCFEAFNIMNLNSALLGLPKPLYRENETHFLVLNWRGIVSDANEMLMLHAPTVALNKSPVKPSM